MYQDTLFNTDITPSWIPSYNGTYDLRFSNKTNLMFFVFVFRNWKKDPQNSFYTNNQVFPDLTKKSNEKKNTKKWDMEMRDNQDIFKYFLMPYSIPKFKIIIDGSLDFTCAILSWNYLMTISYLSSSNFQ